MPRRKRENADERWRKARLRHLQLYSECYICEDPSNLHVHHLRYSGQRGFRERPGDLVTLCKFHHMEFHDTYGRRLGKEGAVLTIKYVKEKRDELNGLTEENPHLWRSWLRAESQD